MSMLLFVLGMIGFGVGIWRLGYAVGYMTCCHRHGITTGAAARQILDEIANGTANTPTRIEALRRADEVYANAKKISGGT